MVRGSYDVSALRADADVMVWWYAPSADAPQEVYGMLRRTALDRRPAPGARWHVREEVPFFTSRRRSIREILATLP